LGVVHHLVVWRGRVGLAKAGSTIRSVRRKVSFCDIILSLCTTAQCQAVFSPTHRGVTAVSMLPGLLPTVTPGATVWGCPHSGISFLVRL
jgi:hypothetical protein